MMNNDKEARNGALDNPGYEFDKYLTRLTNEILPSPENFEEPIDNQDSNGLGTRPTLTELMAGKAVERKEQEQEVDTRKGKVIKFGWMEGVLLRCLLNIWGTMLFLRLTWVVGQAGIWQGLLVITLCNVVTWLSALSLSAISSNGQISGGGVYYVISRTLGPAIGGSIGIMFTIANTISVGTYVVGFSDDLMHETIPGYNGIVQHQPDDDIRIIGSVTLTCFLLLTIAGMDWVTRVQKFLLVILIFAQLDMFLGSVLDLKSGTWYVEKTPEGNIQRLSQDQRHAYGFTGWSLETTKKNFAPNWIDSDLQKNPDFFVTFGVFFTAVTGIVAGANLSGDLKDPSSAIPKGTLLSIILTYISYGYFALQTGCVFSNRASGIAEEFRSFQNRSIFRNDTGYLMKDPLYHNGSLHSNLSKAYIELPLLSDCSDDANYYRDYLKSQVLNITFLQQHSISLNITKNIYDKWNPEGFSHGNCSYGSGQNQLTMTYITFTGWLSYAGCWAASLSSGIASIVGAPRILQAVGKDNIYPLLGFFEKGYNANNDPFRGYFLIFGASMGFVMLADLNAIGILASNFFLASYALMNLSCFHSEFTKPPSWRPAFKYYNKWVSLFSTFLCVGLMFGMAWIYATVTVVILGAYIYYRRPAANWGSSTDSYTFKSALSSAREVTNSPDHIKTFRPKLLVFTGDPRTRSALVEFGSLITSDISLLIFGHIKDSRDSGVSTSSIQSEKEAVQEWLLEHHIPGFYTITHSSSLHEGARNCMTLAGLGKLSPNMILLGFKSNWKDDLEGLEDYLEIILTAFDLQMSTAIIRTREGFDNSEIIASLAKKNTESNNNDENSTDPELGEGEKSKERKEDERVAAIKYPFRTLSVSSKHNGNIDIWWLFDDGGLSLLIPHLVSLNKKYRDCNLRVYFMSKSANNLDDERRSLTDMLSRFRISYSEVTVIPLQMLTWTPDLVSKEQFREMIAGAGVEEDELAREQDKTNSFLRLGEVVRHYSSSSELIMMTLPLPHRGVTSSALYMAWLDCLSSPDLPPTVFVRGNQKSVLTFYS